VVRCQLSVVRCQLSVVGLVFSGWLYNGPLTTDH